MVSITFDEFHAIRNRQRAAADASTAAAKGSTVSNARAAGSTRSAAKSGARKGGDSARDRSSSPSLRGGSDAGDEVAPTSGSVSLEFVNILYMLYPRACICKRGVYVQYVFLHVGCCKGGVTTLERSYLWHSRGTTMRYGSALQDEYCRAYP